MPTVTQLIDETEVKSKDRGKLKTKEDEVWVCEFERERKWESVSVWE